MKTKVIFSSAVFAITISVLQTGCESRKKTEQQYHADSLAEDRVAYDTINKPEEVAEPVLAESEKHFDIAVRDLDRKDFPQASSEIGKGVLAIKREGAQDHGELKIRFEKSVEHLQTLEKLAREGKLTSAELKKGFWPAELMVTHYMIEKWENLPEFDVKSNDHLRLALDGLEKKTANEEVDIRIEGKKLVDDTRDHLKTWEHTANADSKKAEEDLRQQTAKLKAFIKQHI